MPKVAEEDGADQVLLFVVDILNEEATLLVPNDLVKKVAGKELCRQRGRGRTPWSCPGSSAARSRSSPTSRCRGDPSCTRGGPDAGPPFFVARRPPRLARTLDAPVHSAYTPHDGSQRSAHMTRIIDSLADISGQYDAVFCDLWGCVHDGVQAFPAAIAALRAFKAEGGTVVMPDQRAAPAGERREAAGPSRRAPGLLGRDRHLGRQRTRRDVSGRRRPEGLAHRRGRMTRPSSNRWNCCPIRWRSRRST